MKKYLISTIIVLVVLSLTMSVYAQGQAGGGEGRGAGRGTGMRGGKDCRMLLQQLKLSLPSSKKT